MYPSESRSAPVVDVATCIEPKSAGPFTPSQLTRTARDSAQTRIGAGFLHENLRFQCATVCVANCGGIGKHDGLRGRIGAGPSGRGCRRGVLLYGFVCGLHNRDSEQWDPLSSSAHLPQVYQQYVMSAVEWQTKLLVTIACGPTHISSPAAPGSAGGREGGPRQGLLQAKQVFPDPGLTEGVRSGQPHRCKHPPSHILRQDCLTWPAPQSGFGMWLPWRSWCQRW